LYSSVVVSPSGEPLQGAEITWTAIDPLSDDHNRTWPHLDWESLDARTLEVVSDAAGAFGFSSAPPTTGSGESVLWITKLGYVARSLYLDSEAASRPFPNSIEMQPAGVIDVKVVDQSGSPVPEVRAFQMLYSGSPDDAETTSPPIAAGMQFRRSRRTDRAGLARFAPLPGMNWIQAEAGGLVSTPVATDTPGHFVLQLRATFPIQGRVIYPPGYTVAMPRFVRISVLRDHEPSTLDLAGVDAQGAWGPVPVPAVTGETIRVQLEAAWLTQEVVSLSAPQAGELIVVDFQPQLSEELQVHVQEPDGSPIPNATVSAEWFARDAWHRTSTRGDSSGTARLQGCHDEMIAITATAPRFARSTIQVYPGEPNSTPVLMTLAPGGRISGTCLYRGVPVPDFRVLWWVNPSHEGGDVSVRDNPAGSFEILDAPLGEVRLLASSAKYPQSRPERLVVTQDGPSEVVLHLSEPVVGSGLVVDGVSRAPLAHATVQLTICDDKFQLQLYRSPFSVDGQGRFEIPAFVIGPNVFYVAAEGYERRMVVKDIVSGPVVDLGSIILFPQQALQVRLLSEGSRQFDGFRATLYGEDKSLPKDFSSDGSIRYESLDPRPYVLRIHHPDDESYQDVSVQIEPGKDRSITIEVPRDRLSVEVSSDGDGRIPSNLTLRLASRSAAGQTYHYYGLPPSGRTTIGAVAGVILAEVIDRDEQVLGMGRTEVTGDPAQVLRIWLSNAPLDLRIVDERGIAVPQVLVSLFCPDDCAGWWVGKESDAEGHAKFSGIAFDEVLVSLARLPDGVIACQSLRLDRGSDRPFDLVFDPDCKLEVSLQERGQSMPGIEVSATDPLRPVRLGTATSDESGRAFFCPVSKGPWRIQVTHPGFWQEPLLLSLDNCETPIPIEVRRLGGVEFDVKTALGNPATDCEVDLQSVESGTWASSWLESGRIPSPSGGLRTDANGRMRVDGLPNGPYLWRMDPEVGETLEGEVIVPPLSAARVEITLP